VVRTTLASILTLGLAVLGLSATSTSNVGAAITTPKFATYNSTTTGYLGDPSSDPYAVAFTTVGLGNTLNWNFGGSSFSPPSVGAVPARWENTSRSYIEYDFGIVTITELAVYFHFLRPTSASGPTNWTITAGGTVSCSISAGLGGATLVANTLTPHPDNYISGSLLCTGSFTSIRFTNNGSLLGIDALTIAVDQSVVTTPPTQPTQPTQPPSSGSTPVAPAYTG